MVKIITFCIGVDILGFPLFHKHILKFQQVSKYIIGHDPYGGSNGTTAVTIGKYNPSTGKIVATYHSRKTPENEN